MRRRAKLVENTLNSIEGIHCNEVQGAMYAFPQVQYVADEAKATKGSVGVTRSLGREGREMCQRGRGAIFVGPNPFSHFGES